MRHRSATRRHVLQGAAAAAAGVLPLAPLGAATLTTCVFVFLRGGADGLSMLVPHADPAYYRARSRTAVPHPGSSPAAAIDLDGRFGLHPQLAPLAPLYRRGELEVTVGVGLFPQASSHLEAQRRLYDAIAELSPGRLIQTSPRIPLDQSLAAIAEHLRRRSVPSRETFVIESLGWDTHAGQGGAGGGRLADALAELGRGMESFTRALTGRLDDVALVVMTEFGRSLQETPMGGTDDGAASVAFSWGRGVNGGRITGTWPGLDETALWRGRQVAVTTDSRVLLGDLLRGRRTAG